LERGGGAGRCAGDNSQGSKDGKGGAWKKQKVGGQVFKLCQLAWASEMNYVETQRTGGKGKFRRAADQGDRVSNSRDIKILSGQEISKWERGTRGAIP